jgi:ATP-dependent protease ClpP protease subunit
VPEVELKPVPPLDTTPKAKPVESTQRDFTKEFNLSFYGSFLHSENIPSALFLFGDIEKLDGFEFRKALRNHKISLIVLSSPGGLVWEGLSIAGIVHDKGLNTYIPKNSLKGQGICASACSFMFFAGKNRAASGKLGVHQFYSGDSEKKAEVGDTQKAAQFTVSEIIGFLNEFETPPWVFERMFQQSEMYYFKESELLQLETETTELQRAAYGRVEAFISELRTAYEEAKKSR